MPRLGAPAHHPPAPLLLSPRPTRTHTQVFAGGGSFMAAARPQYLLAEVNQQQLGMKPGWEVLQMVSRGRRAGGGGFEALLSAARCACCAPSAGNMLAAAAHSRLPARRPPLARPASALPLRRLLPSQRPSTAVRRPGVRPARARLRRAAAGAAPLCARRSGPLPAGLGVQRLRHAAAALARPSASQKAAQSASQRQPSPAS